MKENILKSKLFPKLADEFLVTALEVYSMHVLEEEEAEADDPSYDYKYVYDDIAKKLRTKLDMSISIELIQSTKQYDEIFEICFSIPAKLWRKYQTAADFKKWYIKQAKMDIIKILNWHE